jgi:hypothetical protein
MLSDLKVQFKFLKRTLKTPFVYHHIHHSHIFCTHLNISAAKGKGTDICVSDQLSDSSAVCILILWVEGKVSVIDDLYLTSYT